MILRKTTFYLFSGVGVFLLLLACVKKQLELETDEQKTSYAIGHQFAQSLKSQNIKVDPDVIALSLKDVFSENGKPRMSNEEMFNAIQNMRQQAIAGQKQQAEMNKKEGQDFLEKNKSAKGVTATDSGLQYLVQTMGDGPKPVASSVVRVHYKGTLITGEEFDSSHKRGQPAEFPVTGVIPGWTEALQLMPVGSKWKLFIPSDLAYGGQRRPQIPPYSTLIFDVELLDIVDPEQENKAENP